FYPKTPGKGFPLIFDAVSSDAPMLFHERVTRLLENLDTLRKRINGYEPWEIGEYLIEFREFLVEISKLHFSQFKSFFSDGGQIDEKGLKNVTDHFVMSVLEILLFTKKNPDTLDLVYKNPENKGAVVFAGLIDSFGENRDGLMKTLDFSLIVAKKIGQFISHEYGKLLYKVGNPILGTVHNIKGKFDKTVNGDSTNINLESIIEMLDTLIGKINFENKK
ncbi:hypothetical protein KBB25_03135, partial [Candidatus Gracilibacteria bacterium]|nr:hypothetical protein [Candidatus Gracilibacteria bacterium]